MNRIRVIAVLFLCALFTTPCAAERYIIGQVVYVGKDNEETPAVGVDVAIKETGNSDKTKADGLFRIFLPDEFKPGEDVTLHVRKEKWVIWSPIAGQARVPADPAKKVEVIKLLKRSDLRLKSSDAIERFIADAVRRAKEQVKGAGSAGKLNFDPYIKE